MTQSDLIEDRIWIDGCFDFFHHGHANAILQAKQLGSELYIGIHSDEEITLNKGPTVMNLKEREFTIDSNKWTTKTIINAPYVTQPEWMNKYQCKYVVHGDDITTDSDGNDCYGIVRDEGRLKLVKRTEGVSTTDLINRLLLPTDKHYIKDIQSMLKEFKNLIRDFATDIDGKTLYNNVWYLDQGDLKSLFQKKDWPANQEYIYIEGSFDLFNPYHISVLKELKSKGYKLLVGIYSDGIENTSMDLIQRSLCVLQSKFIDDVIIGVSINQNLSNFNILEKYKVDEGFSNEFDYLNHRGISKRIQNHYDLYIERQRKKGVKHEFEKNMS
ncbi:Ethanolamine-phosphate cytidylyltransferase [Wickerhamomyces ciferrii]|uniref:ethanolamine-phosphate cytidylyltransferase n=1 Tax=Wickerhamomyces ciferrii (strain ATCC 14091 / BCRC 22168 / CBS 111 / JCM 3599 / NBRC 0793 / NRRL Y-1031 F-60-10) TaxID=1206466 RepID=K0KQU8_WICCF|nr:Ethanolamine-phosphate cytidylyltransferase [Wickerhamomyces ciferrii]CCH44502.1 Ethanolamine-phosphate cytidylyltransferase [Wickerhamomyces ciferrii]